MMIMMIILGTWENLGFGLWTDHTASSLIEVFVVNVLEKRLRGDKGAGLNLQKQAVRYK